MTPKIYFHKIAVLGDSGVGKTALSCINKFSDDYEPTIKDSYRKNIQSSHYDFLLDVLDTPGAEEHLQIREECIKESECFILIYSITSESSFAKIRNLHEEVRRLKTDTLSPVVLVGTKSDQSAERKISTRCGESLAQELNCRFMEISAKYEDVDFVFVSALLILHQQYELEENQSSRKPMAKCVIL
ncbi:ras-domain-containing protein [Viridothelium virens]|uniref:Ras-domain-containing protein n=1 Tax=Viridothelium virens TaxID=1048519 RepID=A0A6A6GVA9_VIRVR|nr:ras-domain-containing protein [Viridothelium virens]